jgi:hypothetical protein
MIFSAFKEFKLEVMKNWQDAAAYLQNELGATLRELRVGLYRLRFDENFTCFVTTVTIPAGEELAIRNQLKDSSIPSWWLRLRTDEPGLLVCDGPTVWTNQYVYLKNTSASTAVVTVAFFK